MSSFSSENLTNQPNQLTNKLSLFLLHLFCLYPLFVVAEHRLELKDDHEEDLSTEEERWEDAQDPNQQRVEEDLQSAEPSGHSSDSSAPSPVPVPEYITRRRARSPRNSGLVVKRKKRKEISDNEDSTPKRRPLASSFINNKQQQRQDSHPKMGGGRGKGGKGTKAAATTRRSPRNRSRKQDSDSTNKKRKAEESDADATDVDQDRKPSAQEKEIQRLKMELACAKRNKSARGKDTKKQKRGTDNAMAREVIKMATTKLWQVCKFIKDDSKLMDATRYVMDRLEIREHQHLKGDDLAEAQAQWVEDWSETVRTSINNHRNYVQGEIRDFLKTKVFEATSGNPDEWPNKEQMKQVILRQGMGEEDSTKDEYDGYLEKVWDHLLPKVCGAEYWSPTKRYYGNISTYGPKPTKEDPEPEPFCNHTNEAFLLWVWENCYDKWWYLLAQGIDVTKDEYKAKVKTLKKKDEGDLSDGEKEFLAAIHTPYTNAASGQKRFGGWRPEGWNQYKLIKKLVKKNREDNAEAVKVIEDRVRLVVRKNNKRDAIDAKRAGRAVVPAPVEAEATVEEEDSDDDEF